MSMEHMWYNCLVFSMIGISPNMRAIAHIVADKWQMQTVSAITEERRPGPR